MKAKDAYILGVQDGTTFCTTILRGLDISDDPKAVLVSKCFDAAADVIAKNVREIIQEMKECGHDPEEDKAP